MSAPLARTLDSLPMDSASGRDRILLEASQLFLAKGYAETSLRTIADAVGMKPASIYHHFESKDALLTEILRIGMNAVNDAFDRAAAVTPAPAVTPNVAPNGSERERLISHITAHLDALYAHQTFTAAHVTVFPFVPAEVRLAAVPERDAYEQRWTDLIAELAPHLDRTAVQLARLVALGAMNSTLQWFDPDRGDLDALARRLGALLWDGLHATGDR